MFAGNVWAANGVGAVLAEKGRLGEAAEVLFAVQVSTLPRLDFQQYHTRARTDS